jgi:hypothetical protein
MTVGDGQKLLDGEFQTVANDVQKLVVEQKLLVGQYSLQLIVPRDYDLDDEEINTLKSEYEQGITANVLLAVALNLTSAHELGIKPVLRKSR